MGATCGEIRSITGTVKTESELNVFIVAANLKTARVALCDPSLTTPELDAVANWYASYMLAAGGSDNSLNVSKEKIEQYEVTFGGLLSKHASEVYYNTANDLSNGCLASLSEEKSQVLVL